MSLRIGLAAALSTSAVAAAIAAGAGSAGLPKLAGCVPGSTPSVRPSKFVIACADGNFYFTNLRWSAWNGTRAAAAGVAHLNDCKPYCAAGRFHTYSVSVTLSRPRTCKNGEREFSRIVWRYPATRPNGTPASSASTLPCW